MKPGLLHSRLPAILVVTSTRSCIATTRSIKGRIPSLLEMARDSSSGDMAFSRSTGLLRRSSQFSVGRRWSRHQHLRRLSSTGKFAYRSRSTSSTVTHTCCCTLTTSEGFLTKRSANWLMCTSPSWCTPTSTKAPKSVTLGYHPRQFNPRRQILDFVYAFGKVEGLKLLTGVPSGTGQFCDDVNQRGQSHRVAQILLGIDLPGYTGVAHHLVQRMAQVFGDGLHHPVGLGMHGAGVQWMGALSNSQKPRRLLEGLGTQARDLLQGFPGGKGTVTVPILHNSLGQTRAPGQKRKRATRRWRCSTPRPPLLTQLPTTSSRPFLQGFLVDVVLVLAHTDGLGGLS